MKPVVVVFEDLDQIFYIDCDAAYEAIRYSNFETVKVSEITATSQNNSKTVNVMLYSGQVLTIVTHNSKVTLVYDGGIIGYEDNK